MDVNNNVMRTNYRALTDDEATLMRQVKNAGQELWELVDGIGQSRELSLAKTKVEEAVMWVTKHITA